MPTDNPLDEVDIDLQSQAMQRARQYVNDYAVALIMQAKTLAFSRRAELVLENHVDEALKILYRNNQRSWLRQIALMIGSAFFGAFVQGFVTELSASHAVLMAAYAGMGFVGLFIVLWGLRR